MHPLHARRTTVRLALGVNGDSMAGNRLGEDAILQEGTSIDDILEAFRSGAAQIDPELTVGDFMSLFGSLYRLAMGVEEWWTAFWHWADAAGMAFDLDSTDAFAMALEYHGPMYERVANLSVGLSLLGDSIAEGGIARSHLASLPGNSEEVVTRFVQIYHPDWSPAPSDTSDVVQMGAGAFLLSAGSWLRPVVPYVIVAAGIAAAGYMTVDLIQKYFGNEEATAYRDAAMKELVAISDSSYLIENEARDLTGMALTGTEELFASGVIDEAERDARVEKILFLKQRIEAETTSIRESVDKVKSSVDSLYRATGMSWPTWARDGFFVVLFASIGYAGLKAYGWFRK